MYLSLMLLAIILAGTVLQLVFLISTRGYLQETLRSHLVNIATLAVLGVCFLLSRAGRYHVASVAGLICMTGAIFLAAVPGPAGNETVMLSYLVVPVVFSGMLLPIPVTIIAAVMINAGLAFFPLVTQAGFRDVPLASTAIVSLAVIVLSGQRHRFEMDRRQEVEESERRYHYLATHDSLTGLANRRRFEEMLREQLQASDLDDDGLAVALVDIDEFKEINDALGNSIADQLIQRFARRLRKVLGPDVLIARRGGDEFSVAVRGASRDDLLESVIQKLRSASGRPFTINDREVFLSTAIGLARYPRDGRTHEELLLGADAALAAAKRLGHAETAVYDKYMRQKSDDRLRLAADLRHAIERRELDVVYQPQVRLSDGRVCGLESLVRWHHPERGEIPPSVFIPIAEEAGIISHITSFVLSRALIRFQRCSELHGSDCPRMSVNISGRDLRDPDFPGMVAFLLNKHKVEPGEMELELTENIVFQELEYAEESIRALKALGVRIAVDDFGAGYSSLKQIARFPIDTLKIDRSFSGSIDSNAGTAAVVAGIMELASGLGIDVVAEGVETEAQADVYRCLGAPLIQGWYYSKAVCGECVDDIVPRSMQPA